MGASLPSRIAEPKALSSPPVVGVACRHSQIWLEMIDVTSGFSCLQRRNASNLACQPAANQGIPYTPSSNYLNSNCLNGSPDKGVQRAHKDERLRYSGIDR